MSDGLNAVNTRCIYHRLKSSPSDPDNITLCPILDFANHTTNGRCMSPSSNQSVVRAGPGQEWLQEGITFLSPHDSTVSEGQELYLTYGWHCNRILFVEYGFVNIPLEPTSRIHFGGEIDIQDIIERLLEAKGHAGMWMQAKLIEEGYWGYV
jgi:hypothetical protein